MSYNSRRLLAHNRAVKGFFTLFYDWSTLSSSAKNSKCPHSIYSQLSQEVRASRTLSSQRRQYSSTPTPKEFDNDVSSTASEVEPPLCSQLRQIMRTMPHSVVVATSTAPSPDGGTLPSFRGMTVSSFTTLTLTPSPIITFNIRKPSLTLAAISESKQFFIHILSATKSGATIAEAFTKGNRNGTNPFLMNGALGSISLGKWRPYALGQSLDPPLLYGAGIAKVLRCELLEEKGLIEIGDHVLILGKLLGVIEPSPKSRHFKGLSYVEGAYRHGGGTIQLGERQEQDVKDKN